MCGSCAKALMLGVWGQHCPALVAHVLLSQLNSLSPHPWSSVLYVNSCSEWTQTVPTLALNASWVGLTAA